jgi:hypothetical protein
MPGLLKIGMTNRSPDKRLQEANTSNTWIPTKFQMEITQKVKNPKEKEKILHSILQKYTERVDIKREFFRVSLDEVKLFFSLMDISENNNKPKSPSPVFTPLGISIGALHSGGALNVRLYNNKKDKFWSEPLHYWVEEEYEWEG